MFEEEYPSPGLHSQTEYFSLFQLSAMVIFSSWALGGAAIWVIGYLTCIGILTPIIIEGHRKYGHFTFRLPIIVFILCLLPAWYTLLGYAIGQLLPSTEILATDSEKFIVLKNTSVWLPTLTSQQTSWLSPIYISAVYMAGLAIVFVALTTSFLRRLLIILSVNACILAAFGFLQIFGDAQKVFWFLSPAESFFSSFMHREHYAAFALIWAIVMLGMMFHLHRQQDEGGFLAKWGLITILAWGILVGSVVLIGGPLYQGLLAFGIGICLFNESLYSSTNKSKLRSTLGILLGLAIGIGGLAYGGYYWLIGAQSEAIPMNVRLRIWEEGISFFQERPLFGWGLGSTSYLYALFGSPDLPVPHIRSTHSGLLQALVEQGILGVIVWAIPVFYLLIRFVIDKGKRLLSAHLWVAILLASILGLISFPFQNPAFLISFWIIVFSAHAWKKVQIPTNLKVESHMVFDQTEMDRVKKLEKPRGDTKSRLESKDWFE